MLTLISIKILLDRYILKIISMHFSSKHYGIIGHDNHYGIIEVIGNACDENYEQYLQGQN